MPPVIAVGNLRILYFERRVFFGEEEIYFSPQQWKLLECLALCAGTLVTRAFLLVVLHRGEPRKPSMQSVDMLASKIRRRLSQASGGSNYIRTVRGWGFALENPVIA